MVETHGQHLKTAARDGSSAERVDDLGAALRANGRHRLN
jgi:hypothetical protein